MYVLVKRRQEILSLLSLDDQRFIIFFLRLSGDAAFNLLLNDEQNV